MTMTAMPKVAEVAQELANIQANVEFGCEEPHGDDE